MKSNMHSHFSSKIALAVMLASVAVYTGNVNAADPANTDSTMAQQLTDARTKAAQLEVLLAQNVPRPTASAAPAAPPMPNMPNMSASAAPGPPMPNMNPPGAMKPSGMGDDKMMGMMNKMMPMMEKMMPMMEKMMGGMPPNAPAAPMSMGDDKMEMSSMMGMGPMGINPPGPMFSSALPGFPGASHLYHCGATGFFLDHQQYITLTTEQQVALNKIKDQALLAKSAAERNIEKAEQELWTLTAADQPDSGKIEAKVREIEKLRANERLTFMGAVGEAAKLLTADQRKSLTGFAPPAPAMPMTAPATPDTPMPMKDM
jgi:Spy/CpxP family protein refolding chaperone